MAIKKKKQSFFSKIKLKSTKTRVVVTALVFAVVGGGIMVYRSFAAGAKIHYNVANNGIVLYSAAFSFNGPQNIVQDQVLRSGTKSPEQVIQAGKNRAVFFRETPRNESTHKGTFRLCALMRGAGSGTTVMMSTGIVGQTGDLTQINAIYGTYCTPFKPIEPSGVADANVYNQSDTVVNVAEMWYDLVLDSFTPSPAK